MGVYDSALAQLARAKEGNLAETPFAALLTSCFAAERTCVLELRRGPLVKHIVLEKGVPVDCRSNLLHETFGKFLVDKGKINDEQYQRALGESAASGDQISDVLAKHEVLTPFDLFKLMQQNLATKLLDGFSWQTGGFRVQADLPAVDSPLQVNVPQLVLTGVLRYAPQPQVEAGIVPFVGKQLAVDTTARVKAATLRLNPKQARVLHLVKGRARLEEISAAASLPFEELTRFLYALGLLGVVATADSVPFDAPPPTNPPVPPPASSPDAAPAAVPSAADLGLVLTPVAAAPAGPSADEIARIRNDVMRVFLQHRKLDPFDLLGVVPDTAPDAIKAAYIAYAERYAPWKLTGDELSPLQEKAIELFVAGARAFAQLTDPEQRGTLILRRQAAAKPKVRNPDVYAIKTELLDASSQFNEGRARMQAGRYAEALQYLEFAADCAPQNAIYRSELAYCRYLDLPAHAPKALAELAEIERMDPECGTAAFYTAEIRKGVGDRAGSEAAYKKAIKLMPGDRRPVEGLRELQATRR